MSDTASETQPLLHFLSTKPPVLKANPQKSRTNTKSKHWLTPAKIVRWEDFNYDSLTMCCNELFSEMLKYPIKPIDFSDLEEETSFTSEDSLEKSYVSQWTFRIVKTALSKSQRQCDKLKLPHVKMVAGAEAIVPSRRKLKPDWAGVRSTKWSQQAVNILPGDTKVSSKWVSSEIEPGDISKAGGTPNWAWPVMQMFTYCVNCNARYGYIITDYEMVAFRVRAPQDRTAWSSDLSRPSGDWGTIEFASINDSANMDVLSGKLTMNLTLWWLHLLAANDRSILPAYGPLKTEALRGLAAPLDRVEHGDVEDAHESVEAAPESPCATVADSDDALPAIPPQIDDNLAESDGIISSQLSTFDLSFSSRFGLGGSFTSAGSSKSASLKRKRESLNAGARQPRRKRRAKKH